MLFLLSVLLSYACVSEASILHCDFEKSCDDFILDGNW